MAWLAKLCAWLFRLLTIFGLAAGGLYAVNVYTGLTDNIARALAWGYHIYPTLRELSTRASSSVAGAIDQLLALTEGSEWFSFDIYVLSLDVMLDYLTRFLTVFLDVVVFYMGSALCMTIEIALAVYAIIVARRVLKWAASGFNNLES